MKIDKSNMRKTILEFPKQFRIGLKSAENVKVSGSFELVLVCGMGGSALPADILKMWLEANKIILPLRVHRDYGLPHHADKRQLIIGISYSGNTEETLSSIQEAQKKNLKIAAVTSGGKLAEFCKKHEIPLAIVPSGFQPRMAVGFQFAALIKILTNSGIIKNNLTDVCALEKLLKPGLLKNRGKELAEKLKNKVPLIYASRSFKALARIWKIKFNENSKIPAFHNYFPELNHNEMVGFTKIPNFKIPISNFHILILRSPRALPINLKRMELTCRILRKRGMAVDIIYIKGYNILDEIFSNILLADWASYYLALAYKIDPTPVKIVEEFKKNL